MNRQRDKGVVRELFPFYYFISFCIHYIILLCMGMKFMVLVQFSFENDVLLLAFGLFVW